MQLLPVSRAADSPFRLSCPPQDAFAHPSWRITNRAALESIARRERMLLLGQPGTGKTLLLRSLDRSLRGSGCSVRELRRGDALDALPDADVLLIDEAGLFTADELERIYLLPNAFVMAGLPSLPEHLPSCARDVGRVTLEPLAPEDVARFVLTRLLACGRPRGLFAPEALVALVRQSHGLLRLVIILAGAAVFLAEGRGATEVTAGDVDDAASMRTAVAEEAGNDPALGGKTFCSSVATEELACEEATLVAPPASAPAPEPAWLRPVATDRRRRGRAFVAAGLTGWACASLAVVALAIAAARLLAPPMPVQGAQDASSPMLASATAPDQPLKPEVPTAVPTPVRVVAAPPPVQIASALPPTPDPAPPPETARIGTTTPALHPAPRLVAPEVAEPPATVLTFSGPIMNDTMGQGGQLSLQLRTGGASRPVGALFRASHGLIGSGVLYGAIAPDGRITLSGRLMMGPNPFDCALKATLVGDHLVGEATFVRHTSGATAHSRFALSRL